MFTKLIKDIDQAVRKANPQNDGDYIGDDGLLHCGVCRTQKETIITTMGQTLKVGCICKCAEKRIAAEKAAAEAEKARNFTEEQRRNGITDPCYRKHTFAADNGKNPAAKQAAEWYVADFERMYRENKGIIFMGGVGTGKTFTACCIANALIEKGFSVWVTTFQPLLKSAGDFNTSDRIFDRVRDVDLLVLDDLGTVKSSERNNELLYELIDTRYRSGKPLIITTNLSTDELNTKDISRQRIYDRIREMCSCEISPVIMDGASLRSDIAKRKHKETAPLNCV